MRLEDQYAWVFLERKPMGALWALHRQWGVGFGAGQVNTGGMQLTMWPCAPALVSPASSVALQPW